MTATNALEEDDFQPYDFDSDPDGVTREEISPDDYQLHLLMSMAFGWKDEHADGSFTLTLNLGGTLVSGMAIPAPTWAKLHADNLMNASEQLGKAYSTVQEELETKRQDFLKRRDEEDRPFPARKFIHLKDAIVNSGSAHYRVGLWRGRLDRVDGWSMGSLVPDQ